MSPLQPRDYPTMLAIPYEDERQRWKRAQDSWNRDLKLTHILVIRECADECGLVPGLLYAGRIDRSV
jgi:hypothetical protein